MTFGPETYTYTAKRYTFPYTRMRMELQPVRKNRWRSKLGVEIEIEIDGKHDSAWTVRQPNVHFPTDLLPPLLWSLLSVCGSVPGGRSPIRVKPEWDRYDFSFLRVILFSDGHP
jgi:hypothetical protein